MDNKEGLTTNTVAYSEEVLEAADNVGLLKQSGNIDRGETAARLLAALRARPMNPVDDHEIPTIEELTLEVFDSNLPELRSLVAQLCALSPMGGVQARINGQGSDSGGVLLCGRPVARMYTDSERGITETRKKTGRFLSDEDPMVMEYLIEANATALTRTAGRMQQLHDLVARRRPSMAPALARKRLATVAAIQLQLGPANEERAS